MSSNTRPQRLQAILHSYLQALDRGENPDRRAILAANPDLHDELAEYFADASKLDRLAESLRTATFDGAPVDVAPSLAKIRYFGDYELLEEINRGGMGIVFKARQVSLNRIVALKMILKGELATAADVRRFRQEAEAAAQLDHPNIGNHPRAWRRRISTVRSVSRTSYAPPPVSAFGGLPGHGRLVF